PPVYALQAAIVWFGRWQYQHPLIDMLQKTPDFGLFLVLALSACVIAPLSEEWFFRVVFQGWLQRALAWLGGRVDKSQSLPAPAPAAGEVLVADGLEMPFHADLNPYAVFPARLVDAPLETAVPIEAAREETFPQSVLVHWLPIVISSVLFGLAHWGHGPAPITLTVLALGLGYVYQRTHSIVPVIVVHSLFNSVSMLLFYVIMFEAKLPLR
ncbi:MAG: CPBP family intramembrane glutamic endopeptidase, partial [Pirellulaceae bacterium]